jgi:phage terminase small subunit
MDKAQVFTKIEAAKRAMTEAERDLEKILSELQVTPRAEKTTISEAIQHAFTKLRSARQTVLDLEQLLVNDPD